MLSRPLQRFAQYCDSQGPRKHANPVFNLMNRHPLTGRWHNARSLALQVLLDCRRRDGFVQELLDRRLSESALLSADRRLATQLTYGVLRRRGTLDALLRPLLVRAPHQVEPWLWDALRLGAFQLALLTHIPPHAAIYETVELAAVFERPRARVFSTPSCASSLPC